jgi:hypothetical protein
VASPRSTVSHFLSFSISSLFREVCSVLYFIYYFHDVANITENKPSGLGCHLDATRCQDLCSRKSLKPDDLNFSCGLCSSTSVSSGLATFIISPSGFFGPHWPIVRVFHFALIFLYFQDELAAGSRVPWTAYSHCYVADFPYISFSLVFLFSLFPSYPRFQIDIALSLPSSLRPSEFESTFVIVILCCHLLCYSFYLSASVAIGLAWDRDLADNISH